MIGSSIFPRVQNLLLAAAALDYGSALTTLAAIAADELRPVVELPEHVQPVAVVPIGRPARTLGPSRRQPAVDKTHLDRYGAGWQLAQAGTMLRAAPQLPQENTIASKVPSAALVAGTSAYVEVAVKAAPHDGARRRRCAGGAPDGAADRATGPSIAARNRSTSTPSPRST